MNPTSNSKTKPPSTFPTEIPASSSIKVLKDQPGQTPLHLDGDTDMYTPQNIQKRKQIFPLPQIQHQLDQLTSFYRFQNGELKFQDYKRVHQKLALIIRPDIEKDELQFIVKQDYELDSESGPITPAKLKQLLFDMVDIWTTTVEKEEYLKFIIELREKVKQKLKP